MFENYGGNGGRKSNADGCAKKLFQSIAEVFSRKKTAELKAEPKVKDSELLTPKIVEEFEDDEGEEEEKKKKMKEKNKKEG